MQFIQLSLFKGLGSLFSVRRKSAVSEEKPSEKDKQKHRSKITCQLKEKKNAKAKESLELKKVWNSLKEEYFPNESELDVYSIYWSKRRHLRTLASCNISKKKVTVACELNNDAYAHWLSPLLYHEMCHAILGDKIANSGGTMKFHGSEFKRLENRHPLKKDLDLWIRSGGWLSAIRSHRSKEAHQKRLKKNKVT
ncbi:MAG: SprT family zinc-dependent metalloprotease [SAR324 cluster bacterium]|uniref:SprT family zinc-dependent metalloprotease n=1 Tax=SAR324 cluster bacterium TaxID=2024889 RepID=A0A7X9IL70_9DELT|nr:SprT family zinc-dependent metalloprotease [SAR324 cluster bacterium]